MTIKNLVIRNGKSYYKFFFLISIDGSESSASKYSGSEFSGSEFLGSGFL